jgi:hypothetical protein
MAEKNDIRTLDFKAGLTNHNGVLRFTFTDEILAFLGVSTEEIISGKEKLTVKFDYSTKYGQTFIGIGKKVR